MTEPLRIGALGAARITPNALIDPARQMDDVVVHAIAAREPRRARAFARQHSIPQVLPDYAALVASEAIDIVYNALPIAHHCEWSIRALRSGKHVLCEKAMAQNADEAGRMRDAAAESGRCLVEAFHYRYHPLFARVLALLRVGAIGTIESLASYFYAPKPLADSDIRQLYALGGGCTMDIGCYPIHMVRTAAGQEPEVQRALARTGPPDIDVSMEADLRFPSGATGRIDCAMGRAAQRAGTALEVRGSRGVLQVQNPLSPHRGHSLTLDADGARHTETVAGDSTYSHQLRAFVQHVRTGAPVPTGPDDAVANMRVIDAVYRAAGLAPRGT